MNFDALINQLKSQLFDNKLHFKYGEEECYFHIRKLSQKRLDQEKWPEFLVPVEICVNETAIGVLESVDNIRLSKNRSDKLAEIRDWLNQNHYRYYIIGDLQNQDLHFHAVDKYIDKDYTGYFFPNLIKKLAEDFGKYDIENRLNSIKALVRNHLEKTNFEDELMEFSLKSKVDYITYNPLKNKYSFAHSKIIPHTEKIPHTEYELMGHLLKCNKIRYLTRYCSFNSAFKILEDVSIEINCIYGMNDSSEMNYAAHVFRNGSRSPLDLYTHLNKIHSVNKKFIMSGSFDNDNLDLWRLYGEDGKGVNLSFDLGTSFYNDYHIYFSKGFFVGYVSYAKEDKTHPALEGIGAYYHGCNQIGEAFYLEHEDVWGHFFKPYEYASENEVRIFFHNKGELKLINNDAFMPEIKHVSKEFSWRIGYNGTLNPFVNFDLKTIPIPLKLKNITLGPAMPNKELNYLQLKAFLKDINERNRERENPITVRLSAIDHYRPR